MEKIIGYKKTANHDGKMKKCIYLTDNSREIRNKLIDAGVKMCPCCSCKGLGWLHYFPDGDNVHAIMGCDDDVPDEMRHKVFLAELEDSGQIPVECSSVEEFIKAIKE